MAAVSEPSSPGVIPHVLAIPAPVQSHINTLMRACRSLASHNILITVVCIEAVQDRISSTKAQLHPETNQPFPAIRTASIPFPAEDLKNDNNNSLVASMIASEKIADEVLKVVARLAEEGPPITSILSDFNFSIASHEVADKLKVPRFALLHTCQSFNLFIYHLFKGVVPLEDALHASLENNTELFRDDIPGLPQMRNIDVPNFCRGGWDDTDFTYNFSIRQSKTCITKGAIFVVNSFQELEGPAFEVMSKDVPLYFVGPLLEQDETNLWKKDDSCLKWLDEQPARSVLYISFGGIASLSEKQLEELLLGLEASNQRFLWAFRPDSLSGAACSELLDDFRSRTQDRGYTVSWAPQTRVLEHPSVGGYMTQCGWNSVLESVAKGVPMICIPSFGDHFVMCKYVVEVWKVGMRPEPEGEGMVGRAEVERVVKALMKGEEGKRLAANVATLREAGQRSLEKGGSSYHHMQAIIRIIKGLP